MSALPGRSSPSWSNVQASGLIWSFSRTPQVYCQIVASRVNKRLLEQAEKLLQLSGGGNVLNTAFIERLHGTIRERLASLTRRGRHSASRLQALHTGIYLIGCTYNFCLAHHELSKASYFGRACTPAMASGLTDHVWSVCELLRYKVAPSPWIESKRRGRPKKQAEQIVILTQCQKPRPPVRPLVRLRKGILCSTTS